MLKDVTFCSFDPINNDFVMLIISKARILIMTYLISD